MKSFIMEDLKRIKREDFPLGLLKITTNALYKKNNIISDAYIYIKIHGTSLEGYTNVFKSPTFKHLTIEDQQSNITFFVNNIIKISENNIERKQLYYSGLEYVRYECNILKCAKQYLGTMFLK